MRITINNNASLSKKHERFIKWKLHRIKNKFQHLLYAEIFLNSEGQSPKNYIVNIRIGVTGHDIILNNKSENLGELLKKTSQSVHRYLAKNKPLKINKRNKLSIDHHE